MPILACIVAIMISAATLALSVNLITAPDHEPQKTVTASNVRQIPLGKTSDVSRGDPNNQLTPVYPASPAKDLAPQSNVAADATAKPAENDVAANKENGAAAMPATSQTETTGVALKTDSHARPNGDASGPSPSPATPAVAATPVATAAAVAPNSCAFAACSSAYRSFRAADCTYQPFEGPRKTCDIGENGLMQNASAVSTPAPMQNRAAASRSRMRGEADELDEVERVVRRLPGPDYDDARIVVIERPGMGYGRPGVIYRED